MTDRFAALRALPRLPILPTVPAPAIETTPTVPAVKQPTPPKPAKCKPNDTCRCGSHKKYKKCCMTAEMNRASSSPMAQMQEMMRTDKKLAATVRDLAKSMASTGALVK